MGFDLWVVFRDRLLGCGFGCCLRFRVCGLGLGVGVGVVLQLEPVVGVYLLFEVYLLWYRFPYLGGFGFPLLVAGNLDC